MKKLLYILSFLLICLSARSIPPTWSDQFGETDVETIPFDSAFFSYINGDSALIPLIRTQHIFLDTATATHDYHKGEIFWDEENGTASIYLGYGVSMQIGQESPILVQNLTGSQIDNGKIVYLIASGGETPRIEVADNRYVPKAYFTIGLTTTDIPHGGFGYVTNFGKVHDLNTASQEGKLGYLGENGDLTYTEPANRHKIVIGFVPYGHANHGIFWVDIKPKTACNFAVYNYDATDGVTIDTNSAITLKGSTTVWDDIRIPASQTRLGALNLPAYDYTHVALDFVSDADTNEITYFNVQIPHTWNDSSYLHCHFHWEQTNAADSFVFHLAYRIFTIGGTMGNWVYLPLRNASALTYTSGTFHNIADFAPILVNGKESSFIDMKLYRFGTYGITHVYVKGFDIHYEVNKLGTANEYP